MTFLTEEVKGYEDNTNSYSFHWSMLIYLSCEGFENCRRLRNLYCCTEILTVQLYQNYTIFKFYHKKRLVKPCTRFAKEVVDPPSVAVSKARMDGPWSNLV